MSSNDNSDIAQQLALLQTLEENSSQLALLFSQQLKRVHKQLEQMSESTVEASLAYQLSVENLSKEVSTSTTKTLELITLCDELDKDLSQLQNLSRQVKAVDKALDRLQQALDLPKK